MIELAAQVMPSVLAAMGAYGAAVLQKAEDQAADATVSLGRRILQRIFGARSADDPAPEQVADLAADPADEDAVAALRLAIRKALAADAELRGDVEGLLASGGVRVTASGDRSIAAQSISGIAVTGDNTTISR